MNKLLLDDVSLIIENKTVNWDIFKGKTVFITGANGYVPQFFVHSFLRRNDVYGDNIRVIALCRNESRAKERFADYLDRDDFRLVIQDVCEPMDIDEDIHFFISAASPAGIKKRYEDPVATFSANVTGFENVLKLAVKNPCEGILLLSSVDVYGVLDNRSRIKETDVGTLDTLNLRNIYSCGKRAAETLGVAYASKYDMPLFIVRPYQILGPGIELNDGRLHADFIRQIKESGEIVLKGDGTPVRSFMYITDAITGMLAVFTRGERNTAYNVCDENGEASVLELATTMAKLVKDKDVKISYNMKTRKSDPAVTQTLDYVCGDPTKLRGLGWKPVLSLKQACMRMMRYYDVDVEES